LRKAAASKKVLAVLYFKFAEAFLGPVCDGKWQRIAIPALALDVPFASGPAQVSSLILICDETEECVQGQDGRTVRLS
jgi:hypothetical protein